MTPFLYKQIKVTLDLTPLREFGFRVWRCDHRANDADTKSVYITGVRRRTVGKRYSKLQVVLQKWHDVFRV